MKKLIRIWMMVASLAFVTEVERVAAQEILLDHFKCYTVAGAAPRVEVDLLDQFEEQTDATVLRPELICNPVDKDGGGINNPTEHLVCYSTSPTQPRFERRGVVVENQFGQQTLRVLKRDNLLCVPSSKLQVFDCGGGLTCERNEVCDRADGTCSNPDPLGLCVVRPEICLAIFDPVCGCDGITYSNDCQRLKAGATLAHQGPC